jgi:hypothetical protein
MELLDDARFLSMTVVEGDCLVWAGYRDKDGYGIIQRGGRSRRVHRWVWEKINGPIPEGQNVLHSCANPPCCLIEHLFLGTQKNNIEDMARKDRHGKTKISMADAEVIRRRYAAKEATGKALAAEYGVNPSCISKIVNGLARA